MIPSVPIKKLSWVPGTDAGTKLEAVSFVHETAKPKQRIVVVGASSIQFAIGTELERRLPKYDGVKALIIQ